MSAQKHPRSIQLTCFLTEKGWNPYRKNGEQLSSRTRYSLTYTFNKTAKMSKLSAFKNRYKLQKTVTIAKIKQNSAGQICSNQCVQFNWPQSNTLADVSAFTFIYWPMNIFRQHFIIKLNHVCANCHGDYINYVTHALK